ncbi:MAG TPA: hypothetical protein VNT26_14685, partial [Candidatus Sulfotelmatobacter sp.]|nr:hypothetical protein [Candidatus Sulfotelmatobacter sp.]
MNTQLMNRLSKPAAATAKHGNTELGTDWSRRAAVVLSWLLVIVGFSPTAQLLGAPLTGSTNQQTGPTLHLDYGRGQAPGNPLADFRYFVALISPEPVSLSASPSN